MVTKSGTFYNYNDTRLGQGRDNAKAFLESNPAVFQEIDTKVRAMFASEKVSAAVEINDDEVEPGDDE